MKKITITFKDPDGVYDSIKDHVTYEVEALEGLSTIEKEDLISTRIEEMNDKLKTWVKYSEYLTVTFDLDNMTAEVQKK